MNIEEFIGSLHPAIVHIPIGLLVLYSLFELVPLTWIKQKEQWQFVKSILLIFGTIRAWALQSGDAASEGRTKAIIGVHEIVAQVTTYIFVVLSVSQIIPIVREVVLRRISTSSVLSRIWGGIESVRFDGTKASNYNYTAWCFVALFMTGALGGAIAHGVDADPATAFVVRLFGLQ